MFPDICISNSSTTKTDWTKWIKKNESEIQRRCKNPQFKIVSLREINQKNARLLYRFKHQFLDKELDKNDPTTKKIICSLEKITIGGQSINFRSAPFEVVLRDKDIEDTITAFKKHLAPKKMVISKENDKDLCDIECQFDAIKFHALQLTSSNTKNTCDNTLDFFKNSINTSYYDLIGKNLTELEKCESEILSNNQARKKDFDLLIKHTKEYVDSAEKMDK